MGDNRRYCNKCGRTYIKEAQPATYRDEELQIIKTMWGQNMCCIAKAVNEANRKFVEEGGRYHRSVNRSKKGVWGRGLIMGLPPYNCGYEVPHWVLSRLDKQTQKDQIELLSRYNESW